MRKLQWILFFSMMISQKIVLAHGGRGHSKKVTLKKVTTSSQQEKAKQEAIKSELFYRISVSYKNNVYSILKKACFDCHGRIAEYPWYYSIPGVQQLIDSDIREAKEHIEFTEQFPFQSHETPLNDLKSIKEVILKNKMPPFLYSIMHLDKKLSEKEIKVIKNWVTESVNLLKVKNQNNQ